MSSHVLCYAGALIVIGAMGLFSTAAFNALGGFALTATAVVYALGFVAAGAASVARAGAARPRRPLQSPSRCRWRRSRSTACRTRLTLELRQARRLPGLLPLYQRQLALHGDRRDRRLGDRAALLSLPVHPDDRRGRAVVHVDGHVRWFAAARAGRDWELRRESRSFSAWR